MGTEKQKSHNSSNNIFLGTEVKRKTHFDQVIGGSKWQNRKSIMTENKSRIYLFGSRIPVAVSTMVKCLKQIELDGFQDIVAAVTMLKSNKSSATQFQAMTKDLDQKWINTVFPGVLMVLQKAWRIPANLIRRKDFKTELTELNIPGKFHSPLIDAIFDEDKGLLLISPPSDNALLLSIEEFRWRVDVAISTTSLNRVLEPSVLMEIKTKQKEQHAIEVSKEKFHELRYAVAEVLNHMQQLEKRSILKIDS